jgi:hypothetical protein
MRFNWRNPLDWFVLFLLVPGAMLAASRAHATTFTVNAGQSTLTIQGVISGTSPGDTVIFSAGAYSITANLIMNCGVTYTGPVVSPLPNGMVVPTAVLSTTLGLGGNIFQFFSQSCSQLTTVQYLGFMNMADGIYIQGSNSNYKIWHNNCGGVLAVDTGQNTACVFFDGPSQAATISNIDIEWNTFGDSNSCITPVNQFNEVNNGTCHALVVFASVNGVTFSHNNLFHLSEGVHIECPNYANQQYACEPPGGAITRNLVAQFNDFSNIHRINWEEQPQESSGINFSWNSSHDWLKPDPGSFGISMACCANGTHQTPYITVASNLSIFNTPVTGGNRYGYGMEAMGFQSSYQNNMVQSAVFTSYADGIAWGNGGTPQPPNSAFHWTNNYVCGSWTGYPNVNSPGYIKREGVYGDGYTPDTTGSNFQQNCAATTSFAPTISPSTGPQTFPLTVTLNDAGYSSGAIAQGNTGIWYTTDGSTPVPGTGTAKYLSDGGTFIMAGAGTVNAVGMWGALNQPTSYPAGYGFVPSAVTSATYTSGGGTQVLGNSTDNSTGGTYPNYFNDVYAVTGVNAAGYTVNTGTVCIAPGTVTNGKNIDIGINSAPTATTEGTTALCHATYSNISNTSPGCVTIPLNGCGLLSSNKAYWLWTITNDPLGPSPLYFSNCGGTCNGAAPTSPGVGTYGGFYLLGTYGSYAAMSSTFTGQNTAQPSVYLGVTPAVEYGVTTTSVNNATSANYFNDVYAVTGSSSGGYTVNAGTVCIAPGTVTQGKQTDIGINTAPTATTEGATALCHATYTNNSTTSPGCVTVPLSGCGTLSPNTPYWLWTITNDPIQGSPLYFSNCGGTCNGSAPTSAGVGTYGGFYLHGTYGTYTGMSSAFTGGPQTFGQPSVSLSLTPH